MTSTRGSKLSLCVKANIPLEGNWVLKTRWHYETAKDVMTNGKIMTKKPGSSNFLRNLRAIDSIVVCSTTGFKKSTKILGHLHQGTELR